jgi:hypothetical protein
MGKFELSGRVEKGVEGSELFVEVKNEESNQRYKYIRNKQETIGNIKHCEEVQGLPSS